MKVKVKIEKSVTTRFTEEEMNALKLIGSIKCVGVSCCDCPFVRKLNGNDICLSEEIKSIYDEVISNES